MEKYLKMDDEKLAELAKVGNDKAEETLLKRYKDFVKKKARAFFIVGADYEDVVQEGMIGLFNASKNYDPNRTTSFKTYANTCIDNQISTAIKVSLRLKHSPLNMSLSLNAPRLEYKNGTMVLEQLIDGGEYNPEETLIYKECLDLLEKEGFSKFTDLEKKVWEQYLQNRNYREIAENIGRNEKAVDNAMQRIKKKLKALLK